MTAETEWMEWMSVMSGMEWMSGMMWRTLMMSETMGRRLGVMSVLSEEVCGCDRGGELNIASLRSVSVETCWAIFDDWCLVLNEG